MIDRLPPQSLEAEQSVLGAILIDRDAVIEVAEFLRPAGLLPPGQRPDLRGRSSTCSSAASPSTSSPSPRRSSAATSSRRSAGAPTCRSLSNETPTAVHAAQYARIVERKAVLREPDRRRRADRRHRLRGPGRDPGGHRPRRGGALRGQPEAHRRRLQPAQGAAPRRLRPARLPPRPPRRDQRRPDRLHRPRHAHDRPPEERPRSSSRPGRRSARRASRSTSPSTPRSRSARASASSASR